MTPKIDANESYLDMVRQRRASVRRCPVLVDLDYQTAMAEGQWARPCGAPIVEVPCHPDDEVTSACGQWHSWVRDVCTAGHDQDSYEVGD